MPDLNALGLAAALGSAAAWAIGAFLFKGLGDSLSPLALTLSKGICSVVMLGAASLLAGASAVDDRSLAFLAASGVLGIALGDTFFFRALQDLSAFALVVLCTVGQVFTVVLAWLILGEKLLAISVAGIALVLAGVIIVLRASPDGGGNTRLAGVAYGLLSMACMAGSAILFKVGLGGTDDTLFATFVKMLAGTVGVLCYGLAARRVGGWLTPFRDRKLLGWFIASVCVVTFGAF